MPTPLPWITDRLPTKADGDKDGDVIFLLDGDSNAWSVGNWRSVEPGQPWLAFTPPATASTSEPAPSTPTPLTRRITGIAEAKGTAMAVADDGTAWYLSAGWSSWTQLPALPKSDG